jgi:hypothetical protein
MFSLEVKRPYIEKILKKLQSEKAVGPDGIPNKFLKYGGDVMLSSLADLAVL